MVEEIIKRCLDDGTFKRQELGVVYQLCKDPGVYCINAIVTNPTGLHARAATKLSLSTKELKLDAYLVDVDGCTQDKASSILGTLMRVITEGKRIAIVANHDASEEKLKRLYNIVTDLYL